MEMEMEMEMTNQNQNKNEREITLVAKPTRHFIRANRNL